MSKSRKQRKDKNEYDPIYWWDLIRQAIEEKAAIESDKERLEKEIETLERENIEGDVIVNLKRELSNIIKSGGLLDNIEKKTETLFEKYTLANQAKKKQETQTSNQASLNSSSRKKETPSTKQASLNSSSRKKETQSTKEASLSSSSKKQEQPNSIVLFFKCHGSESGNLLDDTFELANFINLNDKTELLRDIQENVKITLSSAASVSSFGTQIGNKIGKRIPFTEFAKDIPISWTQIEDLKSFIKDQLGYDYDKDVANKVKDEYNISTYLHEYNEDFNTMNDVFTLISKLDFTEREQCILYLKQNIKTVGLDNDEKEKYYDDLFIFLSFFNTIIKENKTVISSGKYDDVLKLYNNDELAAINEMIQFYCIDNANHRITDAMYYHSRLMIKYIFETSIGKTFDLQRIREFISPSNSLDESVLKTQKDVLVFADSKNEKIIDAKIDEHSMNRYMSFKPNPGEEIERTYGPHIIKAYHNGKTFCSGVNNYITEQFAEAGEDYELAKHSKENYVNNDQYLLSLKNSFIQDIIKQEQNGSFIQYYFNTFFSNNQEAHLSEIIILCKLLGFEKIYITDTSCRPNYDKNNLNIAMRPSDASKKGFTIHPDDPMIGDTVDFVMPGQFYENGGKKWSQQPGKIVNVTVNENGDPMYTINTSTKYFGVKTIQVWQSPLKKERTDKELHDDWDNWFPEEKAEEKKKEKIDKPDTFTLVDFIIPETDTWSRSPGRITREYKNSTGTSYDIEVPGETFENVLIVEDYIKMRTWMGGKKTRKAKRKCKTTKKTKRNVKLQKKKGQI